MMIVNTYAAPRKKQFPKMKNLKTILLVEDNPRDIELTLEAIKEAGMAQQVVVVKDGIEALEYLNFEGKYADRTKGYPAVVVLDVKMPRMDGIEVLQAIRSNPALRILPVVMLTSSREKKDLERCYGLGANAYVVKPVIFHDFLETIKNVGIFWTSVNELPIIEDQ
jgi:CheY-like chemotaxis protein